MQEKTGIAFCANTYAQTGRPPRVICAAPVLVPDEPGADELPLRELYDHPDFIDLISTKDFGLEQTIQGKKLLGVLVATVPEGLEELLSMITVSEKLSNPVSCHETEGIFCIRIGDDQYNVSASHCEDTFLTQEQQKELPSAAVLAALSAWCTGYAVTFYSGDMI